MIDEGQIHEWAGRARVQLDNAREQASDLDEGIRRFTREEPLKALLIAAAGGYLLARLLSMRARL